MPITTNCSRRRAVALALLWSTTFVLPALAQDRPISQQFRFVADNLGTSFPTCEALDIEVERFEATTFGVPPFYMIAYPVNGGTPRTTLIGRDNATLSWTPTHAAGTKLMLNVVDSSESGGGIPPTVFDVTEGTSTDCVVAPLSDPDFIIWSNITSPNSTDVPTLQTCEPWGIAFDGGVGPYVLTIASLDSATVTNVTVPATFDAYTWINRAPPGAQLAVAVADSRGRWATGSPFVRTSGGTDVECSGLGSETGNWETLGYVRPEVEDRPLGSGNSTGGGSSGNGNSGNGNGNGGGTGDGTGNGGQSGNDDEAPEGTSGKKNNTGLIVGVTVPVVVVVLGAIGFAFWFIRRKKKSENFPQASEKALGGGGGGAAPSNGGITPFDVIGGETAIPNGAPQQPQEGNGSILTKQNEAALAIMANRYPPTVTSTSGSSADGSSGYFPNGRGAVGSEGVTSDTSSTRPSFAALSASGGNPPVAHSKASEAAASQTQNSDYHSVSMGTGDEIVIQHRDGGPSIRELPPPYPVPSTSAQE